MSEHGRLSKPEAESGTKICPLGFMHVSIARLHFSVAARVSNSCPREL
jgi:hypothetical protein